MQNIFCYATAVLVVTQSKLRIYRLVKRNSKITYTVLKSRLNEVHFKSQMNFSSSYNPIVHMIIVSLNIRQDLNAVSWERHRWAVGIDPTHFKAKEKQKAHIQGGPKNLHISICLMLNWYSFVKFQPNFIIFGRLTPEQIPNKTMHVLSTAPIARFCTTL